MDLTRRVQAAMMALEPCWPGKRVIAGVSGGADSVALLCCLHALAPALGYGLYAAHLHHGIRGAAADEDLAFVAELCQRLEVPLYQERLDVPAMAKGGSLETAARDARYGFFQRALTAFSGDYVALAHHQQDQGETLLMHLFRGSGLKGLCGMAPRRGPYIRPLLGLRRQELEAYLRSLGQPWRTDATNLLPDGGTRNRIRLVLLPYVAQYINPEVDQALARTAASLAQDEAYLMDQSRAALEEARRWGGFDRHRLAGLPPALRNRALLLALEEAGVCQDISQNHVDMLCALLEGDTGKHLDLPGVQADIQYDLLRLRPAHQEDIPDFCVPLAFQGATHTPLGTFYAQAYQGPMVKDPYVAILDADKLSPGLVVRRRKPGDTFFPIGGPGRKKLKDFFIDRKTPRPLREGPILFCGQDALFIPGYGIGDGVKVDGHTRRMLRLDYIVNDSGR